MICLKTKFILILFFLSIAISGCKPSNTKQNSNMEKQSQVLMGTFVEVISDNSKAFNIAFNEIKRVEGLLSKYKENSEVFQLNKSGKIKATPDLMYILKKSRLFYEVSQGAFDITVSPLMDIWGFTNKNYRLPSVAEINNALKLVGTNKIIFNDTDNVIEFSVPGMKIDLGAIGKGYAVDAAINALKRNGIKNCLVKVGGSIYCLGSNASKPWVIAIQNPRDRAKISARFTLTNQGVDTSGDYEQYFEESTSNSDSSKLKNQKADNQKKPQKRFSHIMNPINGYPADSDIASVTVIANDCLTADALATTIFVLGKEKGLKLAERFPLAQVKIIEKNVNKY